MEKLPGRGIAVHVVEKEIMFSATWLRFSEFIARLPASMLVVAMLTNVSTHATHVGFWGPLLLDARVHAARLWGRRRERASRAAGQRGGAEAAGEHGGAVAVGR